jgi:hypothetical protein
MNIISYTECLSLLDDLSKTHEYVAVFYDKDWRNSSLQISITTGGNHKEPYAFINKETYDLLQENKIIDANNLISFHAQKNHPYFNSTKEIYKYVI